MMIICNSKRFIFVHIQKTGGTSVELALEPMLSWSDLILGSSHFGEGIDRYYRVRFGLSKHSGIEEIENVCGEQICREYHVFATVRHPLARLCSLYNFVGSKVHDWAERQHVRSDEIAAYITEESRAQTPALRWLASKAFIESSTFSQFIRDKRVAAGAPFRSQASFLRSRRDGTIRAEVLRLEDNSTWVPRMEQILGVRFTLPHSNRSRLQLVATDNVSAEDRRYVEAHFEEDYTVFGY
jgi:Sulfotransferase family